MKKSILLAGTLALVALFSSCDQTSDEKDAVSQEHLSQEAAAQVGIPGITRFTEKRMVRMLYELRDTQVETYSYVATNDGHLMHVCDSVGYGLPYGVQFTNPQKHVVTSGSGNNYEIPQAEPNGLFMPPTADGTWIMCGHGAKVFPVYIEPRVIVSPFKLHASGEWLEPNPDGFIMNGTLQGRVR